MKFCQVPVYFYLGSKPLLTLLHLAYVRVCLSEGLLLLLPLHGMVLCLVLLHYPREETSPPDTFLVFTQLALPAPLLGVDLANMVWQPFLPHCGEATSTTPSAGVTET